MSNATAEELIEQYIRNLEISELKDLWETLTNEVNNPSVIWNMDFFLEEYLPECINAKTLEVVALANILTGNDFYVKHFSINDDFVYVNSLGLWESIDEYDIEDLVMDFINDYDCVEYSATIKDKLAEIKEDMGQEEETIEND